MDNTQASPCAEVNKSREHEAQQMCSGAAKSWSPGDKLRLEVRVVLTRITPPACGQGLASATAEACGQGLASATAEACGQSLASASAEAEAQDDCAQNDRLSHDHTTSGIKAGGVDRGVQVNLLHAEVCTETTDKSAPQYVVDEEAILQLMKTCPLCSKQCRCSKHTRGPYFIVYQSCYFCDYRRKWASQPEAVNMNIQKRRALCPRQKRGLCKS